MRAFLSILLLCAGSILTAAILAYPTWLLVETFSEQPIHRVLHRIAMAGGLVGLIWMFRRWRLINRPSSGFGLSRREFLLQLGTGIVSGSLVILPLLMTLQLLDVRVADPRVTVTVGLIITVLVKGLVTGLVVSTIEEVFFRGLLFSAVERESGRTTAILLCSLFYASV